jgi:UDP-N-acetylmuramoyl-tripeptide--D-alanyl-D-alanine ligase
MVLTGAAHWYGDSSVTGGGIGWLAVGICALATVPSALRWLRVAQREHYLPGSVSRFAIRWWLSRPVGTALGVFAVVCAGLAAVWPVSAAGTAVACVVGPIGLKLRTRTAPLNWTGRLVRLAVVFAALQAAIVAVLGSVLRVPVVAAFALLASPRVVDLACLFTLPIERRMLRPFLERARSRLQAVSPKVVAVTGSYGKTSTKQAIAHLLSATAEVVATPASFNNQAGLSRSVNEHLAQGTQVFVAEMGTYGPGEIKEMCEWVRPDVSVITAIGPVHLERFGSEDKVLEAKSEIVEHCGVAVLNVDDPRLDELAGRLETAGKRVVRCSAKDPSAEIVVERTGGPTSAVRVTVAGRVVEQIVECAGRETNVACALGAVHALGYRVEDVVSRLATLPSTEHRLEKTTGSGGALLLDDTYNSNPAGVAVALSVLADLGAVSKRRVVVTPGMVELGELQAKENAVFAGCVAAVATDLVVVGRTNRRALLRGARAAKDSELSVVEVKTREAAVSWVKANVGNGDVVLFENDLPDHYP